MLAALVLALLPAAPAAAATVTIVVTDAGVNASAATVSPGDQVRFLNKSSALLMNVRSTSDNWSFNYTALPGAVSAASSAVSAPGRYTYLVTAGAGLFSGSVTVPAPRASPTASKAAASSTPASAKPKSANPPPVIAPPKKVTTPVSHGGTGAGRLAAGGFNATADAPPDVPAANVPAPLVAGQSAPTDGGSATANTTAILGGTGFGLQGRAERVGLLGPPSSRDMGLPAALAVVLLGGVGAGLRRVRRSQLHR